MIEPLEVGVIGLGYFGLGHARICRRRWSAFVITITGDRQPRLLLGMAGRVDERVPLVAGIVGTRAATYLDCTGQGFFTVDDRAAGAVTRICGPKSTDASPVTARTISIIASTIGGDGSAR